MKLQHIYNNLSICGFFSAYYRLSHTYLSKSYNKYGLDVGQYQFILALYTENGLTQDELTKRLAVDKVSTTRAIDRLKKSGYVVTQVDKQDKRYHHVYLTEKAEQLREEILAISKQWQETLLTNLNPHEQELLLSLLKKIIIQDTPVG